MKYDDMAQALKKNFTALGYRGDYALYMDMLQSLEGVWVPRESDFDSLMYFIFEELSGLSIQDNTVTYIEKYARGGLTSGMISPKLWREETIPHLKKWIYKSPPPSMLHAHLQATLKGTSKNSNFFVRAKKHRPESRSLRGVNEDSRTELMSMDGLNTGFAGAKTCKPLSRKKCIFRDALKPKHKRE